MAEQCVKCGKELSLESRFCHYCGNAIVGRGGLEDSWRHLAWNALMPGAGHFILGRRITALIIMGVFTLGFFLGALEEASVTMKVFNEQMNSGNLDAMSLMSSAKGQASSASFYYWIAMLSWLFAVGDSLRLKFYKGPETKT
jgi:hypothetical protein